MVKEPALSTSVRCVAIDIKHRVPPMHALHSKIHKTWNPYLVTDVANYLSDFGFAKTCGFHRHSDSKTVTSVLLSRGIYIDVWHLKSIYLYYYCEESVRGSGGKVGLRTEVQ